MHYWILNFSIIIFPKILEAENDDTPFLVCKMCEMNAKNYYAFVEKIKKSQEQFEKQSRATVPLKRHLPAILRDSKRKQSGRIVGKIGDSTYIRYLGDIVPEDPEPQTYNYQFVKDESFNRGESSKSIQNNNQSGIYSCFDCSQTFDECESLLNHFNYCYQQQLPLSACAFCNLIFVSRHDLETHQCYHILEGEIIVD